MAKTGVAIKTLNEDNRHAKHDRRRNIGKWNDAAGRQEQKCF
jgi:hypothetical protein